MTRDELVNLRKERRIPQAAVAARLGVHPSRISVLESGRRGSIEALRRWQAALEAILAERTLPRVGDRLDGGVVVAVRATASDDSARARVRRDGRTFWVRL